MVERVIIAVDGGAASDAAVRWVIDRAQTVALSVDLTCVRDLDAAPAGSHEANHPLSVERALQRAHAQFTAGAPGVRVIEFFRHGVTRDTLIDASARADLLVIGSHHTGRLAAVLHSTLALKVASSARCATAIIPSDWYGSGAGVVAAWDNDFTSNRALELAAREAERSGARLTVVHAWRVAPAMPLDSLSAGLLIDEVIESSRAELTERIELLRMQHPSLTIVAAFEPGPVSQAVIDAARGAALLVLGSHGRGPLSGLVLGSVSHDAVVAMPAAVIVVPHHPDPVDVYPELVEDTAP